MTPGPQGGILLNLFIQRKRDFQGHGFGILMDGLDGFPGRNIFKHYPVGIISRQNIVNDRL
jgi:hypothetical protein